MVTKHTNWRTVEEWRSMNVPLSTPSNEASKMFDAGITQLSGYYEDESMGGLGGTFTKMLTADPNFVMGHALKNATIMFGGGTTPRRNSDLRAALDQMENLANSQPDLAPSERKHVEAVRLFADGQLDKACKIWDAILVDHPLDILALKWANLGYFYLGDAPQMRDCVARVLPHYKPTTPLYGCVLGLHAFGLEETNLFDQAAVTANKALEYNRTDAYSIHALTHVYEMTGQHDTGLRFLQKTEPDWEVCSIWACHNYWHMGLFHVEKGDFEQALSIFDSQVRTRTLKRKEPFNLCDSCSLLFRLEMQGVDVSSRWGDIYEVCRPYVDDHFFAFTDMHLMMGCLGAGKKDVAQQMLDTMEEYIRDAKGFTTGVLERVGQKVCKALVAYKDGDFAQAVDLFYPVRYQAHTLAGSNAQRDVLNQFLIMAAIQSSRLQDHRLARALLAERKALKENSPLTDRLLAKMVTIHDQ